MKVGEYGIGFRFGVGFDLSTATALTLTFTKPDETTLVVTNPTVEVGSVDASTDLGTFSANEYVRYTFAQGDVDQAGEWRAVLEALIPGTPDKNLISDPGYFTVEPA